jgi:hypothetical protein
MDLMISLMMIVPPSFIDVHVQQAKPELTADRPFVTKDIVSRWASVPQLFFLLSARRLREYDIMPLENEHKGAEKWTLQKHWQQSFPLMKRRRRLLWN